VLLMITLLPCLRECSRYGSETCSVCLSYFASLHSWYKRWQSLVTPANLVLLPLCCSMPLTSWSFDELTSVPRCSSFQINAAGSYHFFTESDDGSNLYIDGIHLINNDGLHGPEMKGAHMTLSKGFHFLKVTFFEAQGVATLKVSYKGADTGMEDIPIYAWLPPSAPDQVNICT
jgi:hypothetical protein